MSEAKLKGIDAARVQIRMCFLPVITANNVMGNAVNVGCMSGKRAASGGAGLNVSGPAKIGLSVCSSRSQAKDHGDRTVRRCARPA